MRNIQEGDIVGVNINSAKITLSSAAIVLSTPQATGNSWYFKDIKTGQVFAVSEGCTITKLGNQSVETSAELG